MLYLLVALQFFFCSAFGYCILLTIVLWTQTGTYSCLVVPCLTCLHTHTPTLLLMVRFTFFLPFLPAALLPAGNQPWHLLFSDCRHIIHCCLLAYLPLEPYHTVVIYPFPYRSLFFYYYSTTFPCLPIYALYLIFIYSTIPFCYLTILVIKPVTVNLYLPTTWMNF